MQQSLWNQPCGPDIRSVDEVTRDLKQVIEGKFSKVTVEGEVVNARPATSGHLYFSLKGQRAVLPCVMFRSAVQRLHRPPRDGDHVVCTGGVELYPPHGKYQLVVQWVRQSGEGELLARLEALKKRLHREGLFDPAKKRPLPRFPRCVGVVTSHTGAAIRDIVKSVHERFPVPILLATSPVQGDDAPQQLRWALEALQKLPYVDVIVIGRGGGSIQDLWAFNDEQLARAIARCPTPIVSAVGHEIDTVLSDLVADVRAPTPTSVGALVVPSRDELNQRLSDLQRRAARALSGHVRHARARLEGLAGRVSDPRRLIRDRWLRLDELDRQLRRAAHSRQRDLERRLEALTRRLEVVHPLSRMALERRALKAAQQRLIRALERVIERRSERLERATERLRMLSPTRVLERGYAIARTSDGTVLRSHADVTVGTNVEILLGQGALEATVTRTRETHDGN